MKINFPTLKNKHINSETETLNKDQKYSKLIE